MYFFIFILCLNTITSMITTNLFFDLIDFQADNVTIKISTSPKGTTLLDSVLSEFVIVVPLPTKQEQEEQQPNATGVAGPKSLALTMTSTANEIVLDTKVVMNYGDIGGVSGDPVAVVYFCVFLCIFPGRSCF